MTSDAGKSYLVSLDNCILIDDSSFPPQMAQARRRIRSFDGLMVWKGGPTPPLSLRQNEYSPANKSEVFDFFFLAHIEKSISSNTEPRLLSGFS